MLEPGDAIAAASHPDPTPFYRKLREGQPVFWDASLGLWVVTSAEAVLAAFSEPAFLVRPPNEAVPHALAGRAAGRLFSLLVRMNDGAFHAQHKPEVAAKSASLRLTQVADLSAGMTESLLATFGVNGFLMELPARVMAKALGVMDTELDGVVKHVRAFTRGIAPGADSAATDAADVAATFLVDYWAGRGHGPVQAAHRIGLMQQSIDATAGLLGNTLVLSEKWPDDAAVWPGSCETARSLVAEVARWDSPIQNTRRFAAAPARLMGRRIAANDALLLVLASANRDEALNERPDEFDIARPKRKSLVFGNRMHGCPAELIAIEIVAACAMYTPANVRLNEYFRFSGSYRSLPNARIPIFVD
jgi:cytochrome P450